MDYAAETGVGLIIVLDCGIKAVEEITYAKEKGIDFIICDHHVPDDVLPPAVAILNAKRLDNTYPYTHLSGCGVGFKFMQAFAISNGIEFHHLIPLLDIVAVSIASDIVPIMGENRILAYHGLKQLNSNPSIGMKAIIDVCGLSEKEITVSDIVFKIGPRINASGRIQNGKEAVDLLTEKDFSVALEKAGQINQYNETRKDLDKSMTEEANNIVANLEGLADRRSIVLYNEEWHKGVIGIVASRLTEVYYRPAVVLTRTDDMATGSARSVSGFDVYKAIEHCRDLLENFGGHTYAAGLSMKVENVNAFTKRFEEYVSQHILPEQTSAVIEIDPCAAAEEGAGDHADERHLRAAGDEGRQTYQENYRILIQKIREFNENIPPLINAYMNLSPTMRVFDTVSNPDFGGVEETGILVTIRDIYPEKRERQHWQMKSIQMDQNQIIFRFRLQRKKIIFLEL